MQLRTNFFLYYRNRFEPIESAFVFGFGKLYRPQFQGQFLQWSIIQEAIGTRTKLISSGEYCSPVTGVSSFLFCLDHLVSWSLQQQQPPPKTSTSTSSFPRQCFSRDKPFNNEASLVVDDDDDDHLDDITTTTAAKDCAASENIVPFFLLQNHNRQQQQTTSSATATTASVSCYRLLIKFIFYYWVSKTLARRYKLEEGNSHMIWKLLFVRPSKHTFFFISSVFDQTEVNKHDSVVWFWRGPFRFSRVQ